jgi:hypothetical protein
MAITKGRGAEHRIGGARTPEVDGLFGSNHLLSSASHTQRQDDFGARSLVLEREAQVADALAQLIYAQQFWRGANQLKKVMTYWARHRGDGLPSAGEIRGLTHWFDRFAAAIEQYQAASPKSRARRRPAGTIAP